MKTRILTTLLLLILSTKANSENIQIKIKDENSNKDVRVNVNTRTGQYSLELADMFDPLKKVEKDEIKICNWMESHLAKNKDTHPDALKNMFSNKKIYMQIFRNFRETIEIEKQINSKLKREGVNLYRLTNLTDARIRDIKVQSINWDHTALSLMNKDLLATSEKAIRSMFEGNLFRSKVNGQVTTSTDLDFLFCDLLNEKVEIQFNVSIEKFEYFDDKIIPLKPVLNTSEIKKLSDELGRKQNEIMDLTESSYGLQKRKDNFIYSIIYLYRELTKEKNDIKYLKAIEFAKLANEMIDSHSGLTKKLNSEQIEKIELALYSGQIIFKEFEEIEFVGKL
jgi:hypothetical protein